MPNLPNLSNLSDLSNSFESLKVDDSDSDKGNKKDITKLTDEELLNMSRKTAESLESLNESESAVFSSELISRYIRNIIFIANKVKFQKSEKNFRPDTEDLISEGFLGLLSAIRAYESEKGSFQAFAHICIGNRIKSALTGYKALPLMAEDFDINLLKDTSPGADELLIERESENELSGQLRNILSELEFNVLSLYINSYTYNQISEKLNITVKSVDNTLSRARTKLKKIL